MAVDRLDVIIFGATGFTGKFVVREFVKIAHNYFRWGIAGRNSKKLEELLQSMSSTSGEDLSQIPKIIADCSNLDSIKVMAQNAKVVINCCGPYRFYGETVVKACIENNAHHVDVSGEPEYMERIQLNYHDMAENNGVYIVSACGMDSVPADLGVIHLTNNFDGQVNSVESYMKLTSSNRSYEPVCTSATWESAVYGYSNVHNLVELRKRLLSKFKRPRLEPRLQSRPTVHKSEIFDNKYSVPFPGSDKSVVNRSQFYMYNIYNQRPVQFNAYLVCDSVIVLVAILIVGYYLQYFTRYEIGRRLLLRFPTFFSLNIMTPNGPSEEAANNMTLQMRFKGEGWSSECVPSSEDTSSSPPNKTVITEVSLRNPAYGFTSMCVVVCALTILTESAKMPSKGGVYTPGAAFAKTSLIEKLAENGVTFKVVRSEVKK